MTKPLGRKSYGSIPHLPQSRLGEADHHIDKRQAEIATVKTRDRHDIVIVQEKLDGGNVGVCKIDGQIIPLTRAGYTAESSRFNTHHAFVRYVADREDLFHAVLGEGERICGEWLHQAHGTRYNLPHEPFVAFDIFTSENERLIYDDFLGRVRKYFKTPALLWMGPACSVERAMSSLKYFGHHGAQEQAEGAVWRVERKGKVDFLCKYVRHDKVDGRYMKEDLLNNWKGWDL